MKHLFRIFGAIMLIVAGTGMTDVRTNMIAIVGAIAIGFDAIYVSDKCKQK